MLIYIGSIIMLSSKGIGLSVAICFNFLQNNILTSFYIVKKKKKKIHLKFTYTMYKYPVSIHIYTTQNSKIISSSKKSKINGESKVKKSSCHDDTIPTSRPCHPFCTLSHQTRFSRLHHHLRQHWLHPPPHLHRSPRWRRRYFLRSSQLRKPWHTLHHGKRRLPLGFWPVA